jgi:YD repeat-containing protein
MKKSLPIILFSLVIWCYSCSKDSTNTNTNPDLTGSLEGSWRVTSYAYDGYSQIIEVEDVATQNFTGNGWDMFLTLTFNENNEYNLSGPYRLDYIITDLDGNETFYTGIYQWNESGTWSRNNNRITLNNSENIKTGDILILDNFNLSLLLRSSISETNPEGYQATIIKNEELEFYRIE